MATKQVKVCDVTQTSGLTVSSYRVTVTELTRNNDGTVIDQVVVIEKDADLCSRALARLAGFINRGCSPTAQTQQAMQEVGAPQETNGQPAT